MSALAAALVASLCVGAIGVERPAARGSVAVMVEVAGRGPVTVTRGGKAIVAEPPCYLHAPDLLDIPAGTVAHILTRDARRFDVPAGRAQRVADLLKATDPPAGTWKAIRGLCKYFWERLQGAIDGPGAPLGVRGDGPRLTALQPASFVDPEQPAVLVPDGHTARFYCTDWPERDLRFEIWQHRDRIFAQRIPKPELDKTVEGLAVAELAVELPPLEQGVTYLWLARSGPDQDGALFRLATPAEEQEARDLASGADAVSPEDQAAHLVLGAAAESQGRSWTALREYWLAADLDDPSDAGRLLFVSLVSRAQLDSLARDLHERLEQEERPDEQ